MTMPRLQGYPIDPAFRTRRHRPRPTGRPPRWFTLLVRRGR
jgi:hypothetical protein